MKARKPGAGRAEKDGERNWNAERLREEVRWNNRPTPMRTTWASDHSPVSVNNR